MTPIIAIVGRPNVGKSTLFNRLTRSKAALVDDQPGVTRDRIKRSIHFEGTPLTIVDTGGFDDLNLDPMLGHVRGQVRLAIEEANRIIFLVDGLQGIMPGDEEIAHLLRQSGKQVYLAVNKADGAEHAHLVSDFCGLGLEPIFAISAAHGFGVRSLMQDVVQDIPKSERDAENPDQIRVAVLGRPNAGKSSLINRILGHERMLVSEIPGTTRDAVDTPFAYGGRDYLLIDTAGLRKKARVREKIDKFSMIKALESLDRCHIALILVDALAGLSEQDARICGYAFEQGRGVILVVNKWDLVRGDPKKKKQIEDQIDRQLNFISFAPRINVSALTGERVMKLFGTINLLYDQFSRRIGTGVINRAIQQMIEKHPPPIAGRGRIKFNYATQARIKPPKFVIFVNKPDVIHFSYQRYLINQLRSHFELDLTPIEVEFRKK
jgi:GTPase